MAKTRHEARGPAKCGGCTTAGSWPGFAGAAADAFALFEKYEGKLEAFHGNLLRAAVELAKEWRTDRVLRRLEALLLVMDAERILVLSGTGEIIEPDDDVAAIGSGGPFALAAARALASRIRRFRRGRSPRRPCASPRPSASTPTTDIVRIALDGSVTDGQLTLTPRQIVAELDKYIVGQKGRQAGGGHRLAQPLAPPAAARDSAGGDQPEKHLDDRANGRGQDGNRPAAGAAGQAPFVKVEATKFTEVGYVGRDVESMVRDLVETADAHGQGGADGGGAGPGRGAGRGAARSDYLAPLPESEERPVNPLRRCSACRRAPQDSARADLEQRRPTPARARRCASALAAGELEDEWVEIEVEDTRPPIMEVFSGQGMEQMGINLQDLFGGMLPKRAPETPVRVRKPARSWPRRKRRS